MYFQKKSERLTSLNQICLSDQGDGNRYEAAASHSVNIK